MDWATVYGDNPAQQATLFAEAGAGFLHVVDLDGAFAGRAVNAGAVESIIEAFPGHVQLGGGIRERAAVERWFDLGVSRVVIGTAALKDPEFVKDRSDEQTSELPSLMRTSYASFCLKTDTKANTETKD